MDATRSALYTYVQDVKDLIGLRHWEVSIQEVDSDLPSDSSSTMMAEVVHASDRPCAVVIFYPSFFKEDCYQQRHYVVHELLHLHIDRLWKHITKLEPILGQLAFSLYAEAARSDMEEVVDALTYVFEAQCPLPLVLSYPRGEDQEQTRTEAS